MNEEDLDRLHRKCFKQSQKTRFVRPKHPDHAHQLGKLAVDSVESYLITQGYQVTHANHNDPFDLDVQGLHIEVKASLWNEKRGRYQANRHGNQADMLVFCCINSRFHCFIIPFDQVTRTVEIWSHDTRDYCGKWTKYYEACAETLTKFLTKKS
jgi:hypothetical protein